MFAVLDWMNSSLFTVGSQGVTISALAGLLVVLACGVAILRGSRGVWPLAALAGLVFAALALLDGLYADAGVRLIVAALCVYGWAARRRGRLGAPRRATGREIAYGVVLAAITTVVAAYALTDQSGEVAPWGSAVVVAALFVQVAALARGLVAGWWTALIGAIVAAGVALATQAWASVLAACAVGVVAAYGWRSWRRAARAAEPAPCLDTDELDEDLVA